MVLTKIKIWFIDYNEDTKSYWEITLLQSKTQKHLIPSSPSDRPPSRPNLYAQSVGSLDFDFLRHEELKSCDVF